MSSISKILETAEALAAPQFIKIDKISEFNSNKVLTAFRDKRISSAHLLGSTGYGYDDLGRDALDKVYAQVFDCEDALVRHNIVSGTHALSIALFGVLRPGDTLLSVTGKPYDTLEEVIGIRGKNKGSLLDFNINYKQVDLIDGKPDLEMIKKELKEDIKMVLIQRSRGYEWRRALTPFEIGETVSFIKKISPSTVCFVDNCYGEFVDYHEPTYYGADLMAGSLIKNPGGGIAHTGGYIAGRNDLVELAACRLTTVATGKETGASLDQNRLMYQGFFMAPHTVAQSLKTAVFCGALFETAGYSVSPRVTDNRSDIIQAVCFNDKNALISFCQGIQKGSPIDSYADPQPWDMPGYNEQVIMAAGAFVQGASIELSADGPMRPPYIGYMQGGLTYETGKIGVIEALERVLGSKGL